jgi:hypothetical protein
MSRRTQRMIAMIVAILSVSITPALTRAAGDQDSGDNDLRDIRLGMLATDLPNAGYVNLLCATDPQKALATWGDWRNCPVDPSGLHAIKFGYDPATSRDGTIVAGHPAILTLLVDDAGIVGGLRIETDPKARLYIRKKAFLFGIQVKSRYGLDGWSCTQAQPDGGEQPVGGVYLKESCFKALRGRLITVDRKLFRRADQDAKTFVDETQILIRRADP